MCQRGSLRPRTIAPVSFATASSDAFTLRFAHRPLDSAKKRKNRRQMLDIRKGIAKYGELKGNFRVGAEEEAVVKFSFRQKQAL